MKLIIAGGRDYKFEKEDVLYLIGIVEKYEVTEIVSGGAQGADKQGEVFAKMVQLPVRVFEADWEEFGKQAGPLRNQQMALYADAVILFPGGKGTDSMYKYAKENDLTIFDRR